jgi:hypothetical protein
METRKVNVIATRYYSKQTEVEIDVPTNITDDELVDYLVASKELDEKIEEGIFEAYLIADEDTFEYYDETNQMGGTL